LDGSSHQLSGRIILTSRSTATIAAFPKVWET
jgi:hypothetical protein